MSIDAKDQGNSEDNTVLFKKLRSATGFITARRAIQLCTFFTGLSGIVTEYALSTIASYLLGDTIFQWALTISLFLFAMGLGSRLTRYIKSNEAAWFVLVECVLSVATALAVPVSYGIAPWPERLPWFLYGWTVGIGTLIGMEIPLVIRINSLYEGLSLNLSNILEKDYWGALLGGLFFAFLGLPYLGMAYLCFLLGLLNFLVAALFALSFRSSMPAKAFAVLIATGLLFPLIYPFLKGITFWSEQKRYRDQIIYMEQTPYQKIVMTRWQNYIWLYLNGHLQFSSYDEYRYHECLVHPAMNLVKKRDAVLILGGGDGLAAREVLKYRDVKIVTLVDIDPSMTKLSREHPLMVDLNDASLKDKRVRIINADAGRFVQMPPDQTPAGWDVIIIDLPDPRTPNLERLYSLEFYEICKRRLNPEGAIVTQATSPLFSPKAFWCVVRTMEAAGLYPLPYHAYIPTFGDWGWVIGSRWPADRAIKKILGSWERNSIETKFLDSSVLSTLFIFSPADRKKLEIRPHSIFHPVLYRYYSDSKWLD
ncbi:polyamine aminopropyltransferase [Thermodesulforhabdus norvegica]|uniref:Polyamine aminopropyltransferase n=1 Tax=Thermodesulforhabdus norvegica TaxID=39841 RepID=A0A1I4SW30_9BACT|nr:polyamine aminopropyltransferase [Thermodesulforhabdus norvegica]SFM68631.1 spermidine synthase [Thermodesulforhabdus norvegica]